MILKKPTAPSYLFTATALALVLGATMHAAGFPRASWVIDAAHPPALFGALIKGLWLCNSVNIAAFALLFGFAAVRPSTVPRPLLLVFTATLFVLAGFVYATVGNFIAAHILTLAGTAAASGCALLEKQRVATPSIAM